MSSSSSASSAAIAIALEKKALRQQMRQRLRSLPSSTFSAAGQAVASSLSSSAMLPSSGTVALFASRADEIDVRPIEALLRARGLAVAVPRIVGDALEFVVVDAAIHNLELDRFGIPTPSSSSTAVPLSSCALVIVPGLAFDEVGGRLGFGRGYYDRALVEGDGVDLDRVVAVLLDEQLVPQVPMGDDDVRLRWWCSPARGLVRVGALRGD